ncbi:hypothetical protein [Aestuariivita sp.]|jgi:hypothetical protein|uniref:flavodoxin family protein n=1 Tax=Aestuariivita sp. TaxID=1872407 RepID=UPI00217003EB|nr:hypothetical protein [Aestuariivita sp.]MCE8008543.1 hypothetical protein [Aestuariivita sp.]
MPQSADPSPADQIATVFYSRSGHSRSVAQDLAQSLGGPLFELLVPRYDMAILGFMRAGYDSLWLNHPAPQNDIPSLSDYGAVGLCGPIWTSYPATPLRHILAKRSDLPTRVGLFLTCDAHSPPHKAYSTAEADLGRSLTAMATLSNKNEDAGSRRQLIADFAQTLKASCTDNAPV